MSSRLTTGASVALCTYNGAVFLSEQLESIARQTRPPEELVVCDDGSTDGTLDLLERFAASAPFHVRVHRNPTRLGVTPNFSQAISLCTGSVVVLSDQDDVWRPAKLSRQLAVFDERPAVGAVFSDAELVDGSTRPTGRSMFEVTRFSPRRQRRFRRGEALEVLLERSVVCGATLAFRSSFRQVLLPIPASGLHDVWLSVLLSAMTEFLPLPEPLISYRQHTANELGAPATSLRAKLSRRRSQGVYGDEVAHYRAMADRLDTHAPPRATELLRRKVEHLEFRYGSPPPRLKSILFELGRGRYHRYSRGLESAGFDLLFREPEPASPSIGGSPRSP